MQYSDKMTQYQQEDLIKIAKEHKWIDDHFMFMINNRAAGVSVAESTKNISKH